MTWPMWDLGLSSHKLPVRFVWCLCHLFGHVANMKLSVGETHWWLKKGINLIPLAVLATGQFVGLTGKNNVFPFSNWILSSSKRSALTWVLPEPQLKGFKIFLYCNAYYTSFLIIRSFLLFMQRLGLLDSLLTKQPDVYLTSMWNFGHSSGGWNGCFRNPSLQAD